MTNVNETSAPKTLPELMSQSARKFADVRALYAPHDKPILELSYRDLEDEIRRFGSGLLTAGIHAGDHIALFSDNRPRWLISDMAITGIGAVDVPRGSDTATSEFEFILKHSGCSAAVLQDGKLYDRLSGQSSFSQLKLVVLMDDSVKPQPENGPQVYQFQQILEMSRGDTSGFIAAAASVEASTMATIVYTSGTTGSPKGVMLTHGNLMTQPLGVDLGMTPVPGEIQLSILPAWHAYERATEYYGLFHGTTITYSDKKYIRQDLLKLCPHLLPCVPRIWESVYKGIESKLSSASKNRQKMFHYFIGIGKSYVYARRVVNDSVVSKTRASAAVRSAAAIKMAALYPLYKLGDALIYSKVRGVTGSRMRAALSGGGSLAPYLDDFFEVVNVPIINGYGLTETSPVLCLRTIGCNVRGTVGRPMPGTEISIRTEEGALAPAGETGHIWARGPQIMSGYYQNPEATEKVLKPEGWFVTGDLGWITPEGDLVIAGRAKDTIVLSSGENVEPEPIEDACRKSPLVQQILLVGQDQKSIAALVVPDFPNLAEKLGLPSDTEPEAVTGHAGSAKLIKQALAEVMASDGSFKASEAIGKVHLLSESFSEENRMLTNTMKIKKNVVCDKYKQEIEALYQ